MRRLCLPLAIRYSTEWTEVAVNFLSNLFRLKLLFPTQCKSYILHHNSQYKRSSSFVIVSCVGINSCLLLACHACRMIFMSVSVTLFYVIN